MRDPLRPVGAANLGGAALARSTPTGQRWELAVVVSYNSATHTAVVRTHSGRPLRDVPQLKPTSGNFDHLETGTSVVVSWDLGIPIIIGCIDFVGPTQTALTPPTILGVEGYGDADPTQATEGGNNYKPPTAPTDVGPGDWGHVGALGNHVAVMSGGVTSMGAPTAQVRSFSLAGVLQLIARRLETITDFGLWRTENDQGRTSLILRAGANQGAETGMDEQNWTIRLDLGATGDVLNFIICEPKGKTLFRLHVGGDGRVQLYGDGGVDISSGPAGAGETRHDVAGDRKTAVAGGETAAVSGDRAVTVDGGHSEQIAGDAQHVIGGSHTIVVNGNSAHGVAGDASRVVTGDVAHKVGGDMTSTIQGDCKTDVTGDVTVSAGKSFDAKASGQARVDGSRIVIGSNGDHPLPRFDDFLRDLSQFVNNVISAFGLVVPSDPIGLAASVALLQEFAIMTSIGFPYESEKASND